MSKRKGMSAEEKRNKMLELFYEKKEFFQLKELEKIAPKEKGIVSQSVKDVVQGLVDDSLIDTDKIGTSIYYWAYPSKAKHDRKRRLETISSALDVCKQKIETTKEKLIMEKSGREDGIERTNAVHEVAELRKVLADLQQQLTKYSHADPEVLENLTSEITELKDAVNRWTENIFAMRNWCKKKMHIEESTFNKHFSIPEDLDYIQI